MAKNTIAIRDPVLQKFLADIAVKVREGLGQISQRLQRTTPRERILLALLVVGAGLYAPVSALETLNRQSEAYVEALGDRSSARLAAQTARRIQASLSDQVALEDMKTWGFEASNDSIAQVIIEQRLYETAERIGLVNPQIKVNQTVQADGPTHWMTADVQTDLFWDPAFRFIDALGAWPEGFRVIGFRYEIRPVRVTSRRQAEMTATEVGNIYFTLAFPVKLENPGEVAASLEATTRERGA